MNVTTPTTHTPIMDDLDALATSVGKLIADVWTQNPNSQFSLPRHFTRWGATSYVLPSHDGFESDNQPAGLEEIAERLAETSRRLAGKHVFTSVALNARPVSSYIQINSTHRPAWRPQITNASTHEEIIAVLRIFGLDSVGRSLGLYLRSLVDDDPDEPSIKLESLRAMAIFIMSERQLLDPRVGVTPDGLIQVEWRIPNNGILAMDFMPSGLIRFAAISSTEAHEGDRLRVNGTLPKDDAMAAIHPFTARIRLL